MNTEILDRYEKVLEEGLVKICKSSTLLGDELLLSPDIEEKWEEFIKDYVADAVENYNEFPEAAIAWAGFLGMAVAHHWDEDWLAHKGDKYTSYYGSRGWDDMDEHILGDVLHLDEKDGKFYSDMLSSCALATLALIRHEKVEAQTADGFYILVRSYGVLFRIGAALELHRLGYKKERLGSGPVS